MNEAALQNHIREKFAHVGPIWRNNSGACTDATGRLIRYGLGNDSAKMNGHIKSSDLIGIRPLLVDVPGIGWRMVGVFTAIEVKAPGWRLRDGDERAHAQARYHDVVRQSGGFAGFASSVDDVARIIAL